MFLETLNCYHPTIKFIAEYSRAKIKFLNVSIMKNGSQLVIDLFVKLTDIYQCIFATSYHVCHSKKSIFFSQALCLKRICSENVFFDK